MNKIKSYDYPSKVSNESGKLFENRYEKKSLPSSSYNKTNLNRSRSLENIRKTLPRQVKVNINHKASKTYAKRPLDESVGIS